MKFLRRIGMVLTAMAILLVAMPAYAARPLPALPHLPEIPIIDGKRVALIIGNSKYQSTAGWKTLANAENDARYVADSLGNLPGDQNFEVMLRIDQTHDQMKATLEEFSARAKSADVALIYYAGHGFQFKSDNYLVPIDARAEVSERALANEHINFADVVDAATAKKLTIFFLDACRTTDAITPTSDIQNDINQAVYFGSFEAENSGVIYAAGGGQPAYDAASANGLTSPFAQAVIDYLRYPGLELAQFYTYVAHDVKKKTSSFDPRQFPLAVARKDANFYFVPQLREEQASQMRPYSSNRAAPDSETLRLLGIDPDREYTVEEWNQVLAGLTPQQRALLDDDLAPQAMPADSRGDGGPVNPLPTDVGALPTMKPLEIAREILARADEEILVLEVLSDRSLKQLGALSAQGDGLADYVLGVMYFDGIMVESDWEKAYYYFNKAAEAEHPAGFFGLAWFSEQLIFVHEVDVDPEEIPDLEALYREAHLAGFERATVRLADAYADALIAPPDDRPNDNIDMYRAAAELGHARSMHRLIELGDEQADYYIEGLHILMEGQQDFEAAKWMCQLGDEHIDVRMQVPICLSVASAGEPMALYKVTTDLMRRDGTGFSRTEIRNWAQLALQLADLSIEDRRYLQDIVDGKS